MVDRILPYPPRRNQLDRAKISHSPARKPEQLLEPSPLSPETSPLTLNSTVISLEEAQQRKLGKELNIPEEITKAVEITLQSPLEMVKAPYQGYTTTAKWAPEDEIPLSLTSRLGAYRGRDSFLRLTKNLPSIRTFVDSITAVLDREEYPPQLIATKLIPSEITKGENWMLGDVGRLLDSGINSLTTIIPHPNKPGITLLSYFDQTFYDQEIPRSALTTLLVSLPTTAAEEIMPALQSHPPGFFYCLANTLLAQHQEDTLPLSDKEFSVSLSALYPNTILAGESNNLVVIYPKFPNKKINSHTTTAHPPLFQ